jgi:serine/threonine-protein kinase
MRAAWVPVSLLVFAASAPCRAADPSADDLFREGVQLFARGEFAAACDRFDRSYKLEPAPGTLYNLAGCHEKEGKLWQARLDYVDLVDRATKAGKLDKAHLAQQRLAEVEARLPKVALTFPADSTVTMIVLDGVPVPPGVWHDSVPVDRGPHVLEFVAPGKRGVKATFTATQVATVRVDVPHLEPDAAVAPPVAPLPPSATPPQPAPPGPPPAQTVAPPGASSGPSASRIAGLVVGGAGLVGLGIGTYFGLHASSLKSDANTACGGQGFVCPAPSNTSNANDTLGNARTSALASDIAFGAGAAAVAVGLFLVLYEPGAPASPPADVRPPAPPTSGKLLVLPALGSGSAGLTLRRTF